jgi:putative effector of murein hydrolase
MGGGVLYQAMAQPHLTSFLFWAVVIYCVLLAIETSFSVYLARRGWMMKSGHESMVLR